MAQWCMDNKMKLNPTKTKVMRFTCSKNPACPVYNLYPVALQVVDEIKYLGIILNNRLTWDSHVRYVTLRSNRMLGLISSMATGLSTSALCCLYKSLVLPILEYGLPVWNLHTQKLADDLERIQRRASRIVLKQRRMEMSYPDRLQLLNWFTLASRRKYLLLSFVTKSLSNKVTSDTVSNTVHVNTRHIEDLKFVQLKARTQRLHHTPIHAFPRMVDELSKQLRTDLVILPINAWMNKLKKFICKRI